MATKSDRKIFLLPSVRLRYENVFKVRPAFEDGQEEKFAATALLDPTVKAHAISIREVGTEVMRLAKELGINSELGKQVYNGLESKKFHIGMGKGDNRLDDDGAIIDGFEGMVYINATTKNRPLVVNRDRTVLAEEDGIVYAGCTVNMKVEPYTWTYKKTGKKGVGFNLRSIQFVKDGDPFGRGPLNPESEFEPLDGDELAAGDDNDDFLD